MKKSVDTNRLCLGVCYYPEQWPETLWEDDYRRMREMGLSVIRVGEFAWSILEPQEGEFSFDLFDRALDLAHKHGLQVIFGTPTATPPAWLTHRYPEVLNVTREGVQYQHGQRRHCNMSTPIFRELSARIVTQLAEHYKNHPAIIGWQIDNEIHCETDVFYSDADHAAFRQWLQSKYGSLDELNERWGTVFWSQSYTAWEQVHLSRVTPGDSPNPHQLLDEKRFFSANAISFVKEQSDILRRIAPHHFITTNGLFDHIDSHQMTEEALDFISYDSYPNFSTIYPDKGPNPLLDRGWGWNLSKVRDISPQFWVMEQQVAAGGWVNKMEAPSPKPGQVRLWTYQSVAHGADAVMYFRWRTAAKGTEIYWHGINDYGNQPNRRIDEVAQIGQEFERVGAEIAGSEIQARVSILKDYDTVWDGEFDTWYGPFVKKSESAWFKTLQHKHIPVDVTMLVPNTTVDDLIKYQVLIYPHPAIMSDDTASLLAEYVEAGGQLIFGCRSGYKDLSGQCYMRPLPGAAAELCGVHVEDFTFVGPYQTAPSIEWSAGVNGIGTTADGFNDILAPIDSTVEVLASYSGDYYSGRPALTRNSCGRGFVYYYGAVFNEEMASSFVNLLGLQSPAEGIVKMSKDVELCIRKHMSSGDEFWFLLNYTSSPQEIDICGEFVDLLSGEVCTEKNSIPPYGVMILKVESPN